MFGRLINFLEKHYILVVVFFTSICILAVMFVVKPELFGYIFSSKATITSVDNHVLLDTEIDKMNANVKINSIKQDDTGYHINYSHDTLGIDDGFWKKVKINKTIDVNKSLFKDQKISKYVAGKLVSDIDSEFAYLKGLQTTQASGGYTQKIITTTYSGVIGSFISATEEVITNTNTSTNSSGNNTGVNTPTDVETLAEIIDQMVADEQQNQIIQPSSPAPSPSPTTPPPSPLSPPPTSNNLIPTPTPLPPPPPSPPGTYSSGSGSGYFKSDPDIVNTGPMTE